MIFPFGGQVALRIYWFLQELTLRPETKKRYRKMLKVLDNPIKVQAWLFYHVKYTKDTPVKDGDEWQPAPVTFRRKKGDCEDYVLFALECLKDRYDCEILTMYKKGEGHATLLIKEGKEKYLSIGTFGYRHHKGKYGSILKDWGYKDWTKYRIGDENRKIIYEKKR